MTTNDIIFLLLGYMMTVIGMYANDLRRTFVHEDYKIYHFRILIESAVIYSFYYLLVKDLIINRVFSKYSFDITVTERLSLIINLVIGSWGYDKFLRGFFRPRSKKKKPPRKQAPDINKKDIG